MSEHERAWLLEMWTLHQMLVFTVPVSVLCRCLWRIRNAKRTDYAEEAFAKRLDTFQVPTSVSAKDGETKRLRSLNDNLVLT